MQITRVDPLDVDLDLADRLAAVDIASNAAAGLGIRPPNGPIGMSGLFSMRSNAFPIRVIMCSLIVLLSI